MLQYVIFWLIIYVLLGAIWYNADRLYFTGLYRWWYKITHKDPLPENVKKGFIYNQTTKNKIFWASVISTVQSLTMIFNSDVNPLTELLLWFAEIWVTMIGFHLGRPIYRLWKKKEKAFETWDKIESGEIDVKGVVAGKIHDAENAVHEAFTVEEETIVPAEKPKETNAKPNTKSEDEIDPKKLINAFLKK